MMRNHRLHVGDFKPQSLLVNRPHTHSFDGRAQVIVWSGGEIQLIDE
jgi:hypothetical protein